ncbi:hypothetical protein B0T20DRAFT_25561 [Sordaria brevicollis]|uniref:RRM domain-containing protein n=1 Tax=Sordaria brevicollis TaxID=83679 RepID=A0AAE0PPX1_SORBR|nr:hypothetical protein B0T20DRAFT_25561 [Sordaria brevicollis]
MSGRDSKFPVPLDWKPMRRHQPVEGEGTNRSSSNLRPAAYVIPAQRTPDSPAPTELSMPMWRRTAQTPTTNEAARHQQALVSTRSPTSLDSFRPMDSVKGVKYNFTAEEKVRAGFSWKYQGDIYNPKNSSCGISQDQNCSLFLTNIPTGITEKILLDAIGIHAPFGRVFATSVAPPENAYHPTGSAKIAMFDWESAVALFDFINAGNLKIAGRTIQVVWNNNRSPVQNLPDYLSRVLEILGPVEVVNYHRLNQFLEANIRFQTQDVTIVREDAEVRLIRWTFCSFRAQAQVARKALDHEWPGLQIRWGIDPMTVHINQVPGVPSVIPLYPELEVAPALSNDESVKSAGHEDIKPSEDLNHFWRRGGSL